MVVSRRCIYRYPPSHSAKLKYTGAIVRDAGLVRMLTVLEEPYRFKCPIRHKICQLQRDVRSVVMYQGSDHGRFHDGRTIRPLTKFAMGLCHRGRLSQYS